MSLVFSMIGVGNVDDIIDSDNQIRWIARNRLKETRTQFSNS